MSKNKRFNKKTKQDANDVLNQVRDIFKEAEEETLMLFWIGCTELVRKTMMSLFVLLLLDIEPCSIVSVKN